MSFGWFAGDIATAAKLIYNLIQALRWSCHDYREAVGFLRDLKRTLDPLQTFEAWKAFPSYAKDIEEQVVKIRAHVESFLPAVVNFEPCLGRRLQWGIIGTCLQLVVETGLFRAKIVSSTSISGVHTPLPTIDNNITTTAPN